MFDYYYYYYYYIVAYELLYFSINSVKTELTSISLNIQ